jgi:NAD(P)-dependent dehydrogenase (short-subunit alcohol dehydrogenase family)
MSLSADLTGQRILVTGASSEGFGAHFARVLARSGAHVVVAARRLEALEALVAEITEAGGSASAVRMDVADLGSVREGIQAAGAITTCINNAGVAVTRRALDQTEADYDFVMDTNLKGAWNVATEAAKVMRDAGGGNIINTASITGFQTAAGTGPYAMSKAGVLHMTRQLAMELARFNIRVNAIAPGLFPHRHQPRPALRRGRRAAAQADRDAPLWRAARSGWSAAAAGVRRQPLHDRQHPHRRWRASGAVALTTAGSAALHHAQHVTVRIAEPGNPHRAVGRRPDAPFVLAEPFVDRRGDAATGQFLHRRSKIIDRPARAGCGLATKPGSSVMRSTAPDRSNTAANPSSPTKGRPMISR